MPIILPGAEPFAFDGGETSILACHGFTGPPCRHGISARFICAIANQ